MPSHHGLVRQLAHLLQTGLLLLSSVALAQGDIFLFGGRNHDVFLGCFSCRSTHRDSLFNEYGSFGGRYGANSIFNPYSQYGGAYGVYSVCNRFSTKAPVLVDEAGGFYGYLTVNRFHPNRVDDLDINRWVENVVCGNG